MRVLKFGGTSVGSPYGIQQVKQIVESCTVPVVVVVSALDGVTDGLLQAAFMASSGDIGYKSIFQDLSERHRILARYVASERVGENLENEIEVLLGELENIYKGIFLVRDLSAKISDTIVSYGERMSSLILSSSIEGACWLDARSFIKTEHKYGKNIPDTGLSNELIRKAFADMHKVYVVPGFIGSDRKSGDVTTLGRGGSDYTAALIAAALEADSLEIWTDVDGFMTADPRVIPNAYTISELSYAEAMELCNFGAKVVYPPTIYPVCHKCIPIRIKNTFNPTAPGTVIRHSVSISPSKSIKGISSIEDTALITFHGLGMVGVIGVNYRIFKSLAKNGISVFIVAQASSENSTSIGVRTADAELAVQVLSEEFAKEISMGEIAPVQVDCGLATVAVVGENMRKAPGVAGKLFGTLGRNGINVIACAQGASERNISFVIDASLLRKCLNVIHDSFFLSEYQVLNLFVCGIGTVGTSLLEQICRQQERLKVENGLLLNVVGIARGRRALFCREGIDLSDYRRMLDVEGMESDVHILCNEIVRMNIFNSVFVDCTASAEVASIYKNLLEHNVSVVAANKIAASGWFDSYWELKTTARRRGVKFLFETNVGAGLPIINTINDLIHSGDRILKIEAVLSGTLNYIFNKLNARTTLSQTIRMAKEEGFSEPDPRIDLSGKDVIRKLVILAREAGYRLEQTDVKARLFVPEKFLSGSLEEFWQHIPELDEEFEAQRKKLELEDRRWRFVASFSEGKAEVGLQEVNQTHPFYELEGSNNIILLTTERYKEYPMIIKGYGAGADVTAAGVFSDIMRVGNV